jgi:hypothetical protein
MPRKVFFMVTSKKLFCGGGPKNKASINKYHTK